MKKDPHAQRNPFVSLRLALSLATLPPLVAQDPELTNYKTGIDTTFSGEKGAAYMEEYFYHDKLITDRKVVYIRDDTLISMAHNERNVVVNRDHSNRVIGIDGEDGKPESGDEGIIRFKVDRDRQMYRSWVGDSAEPAYSGPFSFSDLEYESGIRVVGTTGLSPGFEPTDKANAYFRGLVGPYGDEWHTITVADDDSALGGYPETHSSDGKVLLFVINPKTPALTIRAIGDAQFYTTPPKAYFTPKIHTQTTYILPRSGSISFELKDLYGNDVSYRINSGPWQSASNPNLTEADFQEGENTLEYYYAGNQAFTKTRKVVKNPVFPSTKEEHGFFIWGNEKHYNDAVSRLNREPYKSVYSLYRSSDFWNRQNRWAKVQRQGSRIKSNGNLISAFIAKVEGWNVRKGDQATRTYAQTAKESLIEHTRCIDPVGFEISHSRSAIPSREHHTRGYYDASQAFDGAFTYDILINGYRSDQHANGITPIEDYLIRDHIASFIYESMQWLGDYNGRDELSMWGTARNTGAIVASLILSTYSTPYYGTSGFDGNTNAHLNAPYPNQAITWKQAFIDEDQPKLGFPNLTFDTGIEGNFEENGDYRYRIAYVTSTLNGHCWEKLANILAIHYPQKSFPKLNKMFERATSDPPALISSSNPEEGAVRLGLIRMMNQRFPTIWSNNLEWVAALPSSNRQSLDQLLLRSGVTGLAWYNDDHARLNQSPTSPSNLVLETDK